MPIPPTPPAGRPERHAPASPERSQTRSGARRGSGSGSGSQRTTQHGRWSAPEPLWVVRRSARRRRQEEAAASAERPPELSPWVEDSAPTQSLREWLAEHLGLRTRLARAARSSPARLAVSVFAGIIACLAALLSLPIATPAGRPGASIVDALFTATSAACVTGLTTVDTATAWSPFGQAVIIIGAAIGGLGIMTLASLLSFAVSRHVGLTQRMLAASENQSQLGDVASLLKAVIYTALSVEGVLALILLPRFLTLGQDLPHALWYAVFMAASIFNNAGFVIMPEGLAPYASDWWMCLPIVVGTAVGAVGFPVILDVMRHPRTPRLWTLHTKLTLSTYLALAVISSVTIAAFEWNNPNTYGAQPVSGRVLTALVNGVNARSSGLSTIPTEHMNEATWFLQDALMFIGGGSASTAGGIKVSTFAVLLLAIAAEARGDQDIEAFGRRITLSTVRLSVAVAFIGAAIVGVSTLVLLQISELSLDRILFEVISAFATVGLSTGITPMLPVAGKYVIIVLMFVGRVGTMTAASALAMRERRRVIRMPAERPLIG